MGLILGKGIKAAAIKGWHINLGDDDAVMSGTTDLFSFDTTNQLLKFFTDTKFEGDLSAYQALNLYAAQGTNNESATRRDFVEGAIANAIGGITSGTTWLQPVRQLTSNPTSISNIAANDRAIVGAAPAGDFSSFTVGDIVSYDGAVWSVDKEVENINSGSAIYPTDETNQFFTYIDGAGWLDHFFEATTVMPASVIKLTGLELSLEEQNEGQIILGQGTGNQPEPKSMSGDATIDENGILTIADNAITEDKIDSDAVTTDKILDGSVSSSKINSNAITTVKILDSNVTNAKLASNAVTTDKILDGTITESDLTSTLQDKINEEGGHEVDDATIEEYIDANNNNANTLKVKDLGINNAQIGSGAIASRHLASSSVLEAAISTGAVSTFKLANDAVITDKISNLAVTNAKLADKSVNNAKLNFIDGQIVVGYNSDGSTGDSMFSYGSNIGGTGIGGLRASNLQVFSRLFAASIDASSYVKAQRFEMLDSESLTFVDGSGTTTSVINPDGASNLNGSLETSDFIKAKSFSMKETEQLAFVDVNGTPTSWINPQNISFLEGTIRVANDDADFSCLLRRDTIEELIESSANTADDYSTFNSYDDATLVSLINSFESYTLVASDITAKSFTIDNIPSLGSNDASMTLDAYGAIFNTDDDVTFTIVNTESVAGSAETCSLTVDWTNNADLVALAEVGDVFTTYFSSYKKLV